jgi:hypothetical protein
MTSTGDGDLAIQRALAAACLDERASLGCAADVAALLERHGVASDDAAAILAQPPGRFAVVRSLVRNALSGVILRVLPRTRACVDAADTERFSRDCATFLDCVGPRTHVLRDVPFEFFAWAAPEWREDPVLPPHVIDLAAFELAAFHATSAIEPCAEPSLTDLGLDRRVALHPSARLLRCAWAVHEVPETEPDDRVAGPPERRPVALLAHRDATHTVRWLELTPLAAALFERLAAGLRLDEAVAAACEATDARFEADAVASLLADLGERGVLLGARE